MYRCSFFRSSDPPECDRLRSGQNSGIFPPCDSGHCLCLYPQSSDEALLLQSFYSHEDRQVPLVSFRALFLCPDASRAVRPDQHSSPAAVWKLSDVLRELRSLRKFASHHAAEQSAEEFPGRQ